MRRLICKDEEEEEFPDFRDHIFVHGFIKYFTHSSFIPTFFNISPITWLWPASLPLFNILITFSISSISIISFPATHFHYLLNSHVFWFHRYIVASQNNISWHPCVSYVFYDSCRCSSSTALYGRTFGWRGNRDPSHVQNVPIIVPSLS